MGLRDGEDGDEGLFWGKSGANVEALMFNGNGTGEAWAWAWRWIGSVWGLNWNAGGFSFWRVGDIVHGGVEILRGDGRTGV